MPDTGIRHTAESDKTQTPDFSSRRIGIAPDRRGIMEVKDILEAQRRFFAAGNTLDPAIRKQYLKALQTEIRKREKEICGALHEDLRKSEFESRTTETGIVLDELASVIRNLKRYTATRRAAVSMLNFPAKGFIRPEPYGNVLIFSAWNYPFQLLFAPFLGAVAAGNCVILKPAEQAPATAEAAKRIVEAVFPPEYVSVCCGGHETTRELLAEPFDSIFYTGGPGGAKLVARAAAERFTPLTLELGGKSPCIVDEDANIDLTARRIVWGKFLNAGQTCVAPDYILAHKTVVAELTGRLKHWIRRFYGDNPETSPDYPRIISPAHCERLASLLPGSEILSGGRIDPETKYMRGKDSKGNWRSPFSPIAYQGPGSVNGWGDITEGFTMQYTWYVPQDVQGYINEAGEKLFHQRLDDLFTVELPDSIPGAHDIQGRIGGYWHGNEPCHHVAYLYNYLKEPWKCQKWIRTIVDRFYGNTPDALAGNDDCGQMSAWYMFNCLGFYPIAPSSNIYNIGSPCVKALSVRMSNGKHIEMEAENWSPENVYVKTLYVNGKKCDKSYLTYDDIRNGVKLRFVMDKKPNKRRAVSDEAVPPSLSQPGKTMKYQKP